MKKLFIFALFISSLVLIGYVSKIWNVSNTLINDDFSTFDQNIWSISKGNISVNNGILTIDSEGCREGYIKHSLPISEWQVLELRAKVEKIYGSSVGDIVSGPACIYYNNLGLFCIWDIFGQRDFGRGDHEWHIWKIVRTEDGLDIYMDDIFQLTSALHNTGNVTLGCVIADKKHGVRVSYDWITVK